VCAHQYLPDETFWDYYEDNRVQNEVFNQAMAGTLHATLVQTIRASHTLPPPHSLETNALRGAAVIEDYDFRQFEVRIVIVSLHSLRSVMIAQHHLACGAQHVVDVGGGRGKFVNMLLRRYVNMTATIYDQQHVIDEAIIEWQERYGKNVINYQGMTTIMAHRTIHHRCISRVALCGALKRAQIVCLWRPAISSRACRRAVTATCSRASSASWTMPRPSLFSRM
jgi:hypothetical protein